MYNIVQVLVKVERSRVKPIGVIDKPIGNDRQTVTTNRLVIDDSVMHFLVVVVASRLTEEYCNSHANNLQLASSCLVLVTSSFHVH